MSVYFAKYNININKFITMKLDVKQIIFGLQIEKGSNIDISAQLTLMKDVLHLNNI